jgi:hypothetical protein
VIPITGGYPKASQYLNVDISIPSNHVKTMDKHSEKILPELNFDLDLSKKGRGTYDAGEFIFKRGDEPYKGSPGQLRLKSRKGGDAVVAKLYSDLDGNGRFSKDELIFKGSADGDDIHERLEGSSGKIRWDYDDCTPCRRMPFNLLSINPDGSDKVDFFSIGMPGNIPGIAVGDSLEAM